MQGRRVSYGAIRLNVLYQSVVDVLLFLSFTKQQIKAQSNNKLMTAELTITLANSNPKLATHSLINHYSLANANPN
jgi:hypothetical protein